MTHYYHLLLITDHHTVLLAASNFESRNPKLIAGALFLSFGAFVSICRVKRQLNVQSTTSVYAPNRRSLRLDYLFCDSYGGANSKSR
ncbi:hypothetical protein L596_014418 [Steinernema carpocapsae]|uniref:Uncharacterized protein n=1 Tax=Steinernema carpocapsae TaxID=34508 RepID=A0A4U5NBW4_STECR|nr:hypothetical protein L596_014418 [Steinernema carpocapsae]